MQQHTVKKQTLNPMKTSIISVAVILACGVISPQAQAALASNAILKFSPGVLGGYYGNAVISGSYFGMDSNGGGISKTERTAIKQNAGLIIGSTQPASGSHTGKPDGSESPGIDRAWSFFKNTGLHQSTAAVTIVSDDNAGNVELNFSGWNVAWNGIPSIDMGKNAWAGNNDGVATVKCAATCANGDTYTLDYSATVPLGDPSGFGGVQYEFHLIGTISVPDALTASSGTLAVGSYASNAGSSNGRISMADLTSTTNGNAIKADTGYAYGGSLYDFKVTGVSGSTQIMIPLTVAIPANAIYRKYTNNAWTTFTADSSNLIASAAKVSGVCPAANNAAYNHTNGLVTGDECLQLTIVDNGPYDDDATTGTIADPGGVATAIVQQVDTRTWGSSGCSMSQNPVAPTQRADWWLVAGFFAALAWLRSMRRKSHAA